MTWRRLQGELVARLRDAGLPMPEGDARRIVAEAAGCSPAELALHLDERPTELAAAHATRMADRRAAGEPLQYALGSWGFRTLDLFVDRRVLIPRPETEVVAGHAIAEVDRLHAAGGHVPVVVDLGTGSGAIGLAVAAERDRVEVWCTDRSAEALEVARANLVGLGRAATHVRLARGDWYGALPERLVGAVGVVVANPPYVASGAELPAEVSAWEPAEALFAGADGLDDLRTIVAGAPDWLRPSGALVVELDPRQAHALAELAGDVGLRDVRVHPDLAGRDRVLVARR